MPYSITQNNPDCSGWAVVDPDNVVFGCHKTKADAIKQAVAISLATDEPFVGERALPDLSAPQFMRDAAGQGVKWFEDGLAGDGVTAGTVREARLMASGDVSEDKWRRISAWIARHLVDLDAPDAKPGADGYPSPGVVAHALWGSENGKVGALRTQDYADRLLARIQAESRNMNGPTVKISDIDGTLIQSGRRVEKTWTFLQNEPGSLFIVTGRPESERDKTVQQLKDLNITYSRLIMNPSSTADSPEYKKATAEELLKTYNVTVAVENDPQTLIYYDELGIDAVDPRNIDAQGVEAQSGDAQAVDESSAYRAGKISDMGKVETREFTTTIELRAEGDGNTFSGYAALFNTESLPLPFTEVIAPGAFKRSLRSRNDVKLLWNHDSSMPLASTRSGTMTLVEDERGLKVTATLPHTSAGNDARELIQKNIVDAMSFGFSVPAGGDSWSNDGSIRTLKSVRLHEVSIVAWPAYEATGGTVSVRALDKVAQRAEVDADALQDVLTRIEDGAESLTTDDRRLLEQVLDRLAPAEQADEIVGDLDLLALKKKKLNLLENY
jgi:HK97 family phage prohead protease